jgi:hypothetical protein
LNACATATPNSINIPQSLLTAGQPGIVSDPTNASQADAAIAYSKTYATWEACAANLAQIKKLNAE